MLQIISMGDVLQDCLSRFPKIDSLMPEQIVALQSLLAGDDVLAILPTGFRKSFIYQVFCLAKQFSNPNASVLVISPLNSIVEEQVATKVATKVPFHFLFRGAMSVKRISRFVEIYARRTRNRNGSCR